MSTENIKVYCRVKPVLGLAKLTEYEVKNDVTYQDAGSIEMFIPSNSYLKYTNNRAPSYKFTFNHVFDQTAEQEEIYRAVARPVVENAIQGYNGTIFVYGQTATGKTYTILGEEATQQLMPPKTKKVRKKWVNAIRRHQEKEVASKKSKNEVVAESVTPQVQTTPLSEEIDGKRAIEDGSDQIDLNLDPKLELNPNPELKDTPAAPVPNPETQGIVPRTLSDIFSYLSSYDSETKLEASYYEIYKEQGYDLLSGFNESKRAFHMGHLQRIKAMTDAKHNLHLKNLSMHLIRHEKDALELLEHGNANRQIAETHLNQASSRSHCIFTIYLTIKHPETDSILKPKIHLVDLAGSERIGKSHETNQKIMSEGKNINLSLHHFHLVIVALSKRQDPQQQKRHLHVPFRNSTMTLVLSDSLGGNSRTSMIATISAEGKNLEESLSTCRFAQQVATISNRMVINEIEDSDRIIARLRLEIQQMKVDLERSVTPVPSSPSPIMDDEDLLELIEEYLQSENEFLAVGRNQENLQFCFNEMRLRLQDQIENNQELQKEQVLIEEAELLEMIQVYLEDEKSSALLDVGYNQENIQFCFSELKERLLEQIEENKRVPKAKEEADLLETIQEYLKTSDGALDVGENQDNIQFCYNELKQRLQEQIEENEKMKKVTESRETQTLKPKSKACVIL